MEGCFTSLPIAQIYGGTVRFNHKVDPMCGERRYKVTVQRAYEVFAKNELEAGTNAKSFASGQWASKIPTQILVAPKKGNYTLDSPQLIGKYTPPNAS
jgi:hypothetical protein